MLESIPTIDLVFMLGFFMALALRRGRVDKLVGGFLEILPMEGNPGFGSDKKATVSETSDEDPR